MQLNERGFTLYEMMVAIGIGGFAMMIAVGTLVSISNQNSAFARAIDNDIEESRAIGVINAYMGQATQLKYYGNNNLNSYASPVGDGQIRDYDSNDYFGDSPATDTLAVYWRDAAHSTSGVSPVGLVSDLKRTAIYFQKPSPSTFGILYVNSGVSLSLRPSQSELTFEGLERVRIMNVATYRADASVPAIGAPVTSFEIEMTFRRFFAVGERAAAHTFCPDLPAFAASCPSQAPHADIVRTYHVDIRDNVLMMSLSGSRGARLYDQIHFFAPNTPGGL